MKNSSSETTSKAILTAQTSLSSISHDIYDHIIDDIAKQGWSVQTDFLPGSLIEGLIEEELRLWKDDQFRKAQIGGGNQQQVHSEIRTDRIYWIDSNPANQAEPVRQYLEIIGTLRKAMNKSLFLSLRSFEAHFAVYPEGSFYKRHLDQFKDGQDRLISCILYLNPGWKKADGGLLRIYENTESNQPIMEVIPEAGTFVCFRSDLIPHEVLKANRQRLSLTGWLRREAYV